MNVGDKGVLKASSRVYKIISEIQTDKGYIETIKFFDNGEEVEVSHQELCSATRSFTDDEERRYKNK